MEQNFKSAKTHYRRANDSYKSACGKLHVKLTRSKVKVDCQQCQKTELFKKTRSK